MELLRWRGEEELRKIRVRNQVFLNFHVPILSPASLDQSVLLFP